MPKGISAEMGATLERDAANVLASQRAIWDKCHSYLKEVSLEFDLYKKKKNTNFQQ